MQKRIVKEEYKSVGCGFYDELNAFAVLGRSCEIIFLNEKASTSYFRKRASNILKWAKALNFGWINLFWWTENHRKSILMHIVGKFAQKTFNSF